jgi:S1-C subfamily serine protease
MQAFEIVTSAIMHNAHRSITKEGKISSMSRFLGTKRFWNFQILTSLIMLALAASPALALESDEMENITIYEKSAPAVVTITVITEDGPSSGAGVIIDPSGIIITSRHVTGEANTAKITLESGDEINARVLAKIGLKSDLAILKAENSKQLPYVRLGNSQGLRVGQKVLAIGNPYGFDRTLTLGIISRLDKQRNRIQTDASINPGNSGGPLLNTDGEVIGINQSIFNPDGRRTNIGIGFAVPVDTAKDFIKEVANLPDQQYRTATEIPMDMTASQQDIPVQLQLKEFSKQF